VVANTPAYLDLNTAKLEVTVVVEDSAEEKAMDSVEVAMDSEEVEKATEEVDSAVAMDLEEDTTSRHIRTQYR
jgi:cbb3-type cytochrome oxidase cytochrome c subunit